MYKEGIVRVSGHIEWALRLECEELRWRYLYNLETCSYLPTNIAICVICILIRVFAGHRSAKVSHSIIKLNSQLPTSFLQVNSQYLGTE